MPQVTQIRETVSNDFKLLGEGKSSSIVKAGGEMENLSKDDLRLHDFSDKKVCPKGTISIDCVSVAENWQQDVKK